MSERFSDKLRRKYEAIWEAQHRHPFVRGLGDGSLDEAKFQVWLRQDYLYLIEYARLFALAAARAPDEETMRWMINMAHGVLHNELLLHKAYAIEFGLHPDELARGHKSPTTQAYSDHLMRTGGLGAYLDLAAALLPCTWGYSEIGHRLAHHERDDNRYSRWIDMYSGPVAAQLAKVGRDLLDRLAEGAGPERLESAERAFAVSSRYEWMFWEMCWHGGEQWPV